jgi:hypothetical protein
MYLRTCWVENAGPIDHLHFIFPFNSTGTPKPLILVGRNGSGKSIMLSMIVDALILFAQTAYYDIIKGSDGYTIPLFRILGTINQKINSEFGVALLKFDHNGKSFYYVEKTGELEYSSYIAKLPKEFDSLSGIKPWEPTEDYKEYTKAEKNFEEIFMKSSICFFPASRKETPHWLNPRSLGIESQLVPNDDFHGYLRKPIFVESSSDENKRWLLDVFLDSLIDSEMPETDQADECTDVHLIDGGSKIYSEKIDPKTKLLLKQSRKNIETVLKKILGNEKVILKLNNRDLPGYRLCISDGKKILVPSLDHLSMGQSIVFNIFATIIRYSDKGDITKSRKLDEIEGIVIIDEIELHLHTDLQHDVLPGLIGLFPRVQFIITTHSPLFLLGMRKCMGDINFQIIEMPDGQIISAERFSEFQESFDNYKNTEKFESELKALMLEGIKPIVLTEGETDPKYITAAFDVLGRNDILEKLRIEWVGKRNKQSTANAGVSGLNSTRTVLDANPGILKHRLLLLYDCDAAKPDEDVGLISIRTIPRNEENKKIKKGIENLFPMGLFEERFYGKKTENGDYGEEKIIPYFKKVEFCKWVCTDGKTADNFQYFSAISEILVDFIEKGNAKESQ